MDPLRLYLLAGLVGHKVVWEVLKRRSSHPSPSRPQDARAVLARAVKLCILAGIVIQIFSPDVLPVAAHARPLRILGLTVYTAGLAVAVTARLQLGRNWSDIESARLNPGHRVVSGGIYRLIRHPIYTGDLALLLGLELALNSWLFVAVLFLTPFVLREAIREEMMLVRSLPGYAEYCGRTRRFLPFIV